MWEGAVNWMEVREVEATMQSCDTFMRQILKENVLKQLDMEMDDVEPIGLASNPVEHNGMRGEMAVDSGEPQSPWDTGNQIG